MKRDQKLSELTLEELQEKHRTSKLVLTGTGITMAISLIAVVYFAIESKNYVLLALAFALPITLMPLFVYLKQLNTEIKSRSLS